MNQKAIALLKAITTKTKQGKSTWDEVVRDTYRTALSQGLIRISKNTDSGEDDSYDVTICDKLGRVVEDIHFSPVPGMLRNAGGAEEEFDFDIAAELFEVARRSALSADDILDEMLLSVNGK